MTKVLSGQYGRGPAQWNQLTNLNEDLCARTVSERQSQLPGSYVTSNFLRPCESPAQYSANMTEPLHQYKTYAPDACRISTDTQLRAGAPTNLGEIYQLFTRPYHGAYMGAGTNSGCNRDLESRLLFGTPTTTYKACEPLSEVSINTFYSLPDYGNPQRVEHVIPPFPWGGIASRDAIRRINHDKFCKNQGNKRYANRK
jgi:hypothetical protein